MLFCRAMLTQRLVAVLTPTALGISLLASLGLSEEPMGPSFSRCNPAQRTEMVRRVQTDDQRLEQARKALERAQHALGLAESLKDARAADVARRAIAIANQAMDEARARKARDEACLAAIDAAKHRDVRAVADGSHRPLRAPGFPLVPASQLGLLDASDLKAFLAGLPDEDLKRLALWAGARDGQLKVAIDGTKNKETAAQYAGYTEPAFTTWKEALQDKIMDDLPLARTMETLGQGTAGISLEVNPDDFNYKAYKDLETLTEKISDFRGAAEIEAAMAYKKFMEAGDFKEGAMNALPYTGEMLKKFMPSPEDLQRYGQHTVRVAEKAEFALRAVEETTDISYRGMDMYLFNEAIRRHQSSNQTLAITLSGMRADLLRKQEENQRLQACIREELRRR